MLSPPRLGRSLGIENVGDGGRSSRPVSATRSSSSPSSRGAPRKPRRFVLVSTCRLRRSIRRRVSPPLYGKHVFARRKKKARASAATDGSKLYAAWLKKIELSRRANNLTVRRRRLALENLPDASRGQRTHCWRRHSPSTNPKFSKLQNRRACLGAKSTPIKADQIGTLTEKTPATIEMVRYWYRLTTSVISHRSGRNRGGRQLS